MALDNDDIQQLITLLQKLVVNSSDNSTDEPVVKKTRKTKTKNKNTSQPTKKKFINKFNDMPEMNMFKEDVAIDKKLQKGPPTPRNRPFSFVKVQCRVCGKSDEVPETLVETIDRYKCNKCATGAG
jgi:hypothetical protein